VVVKPAEHNSRAPAKSKAANVAALCDYIGGPEDEHGQARTDIGHRGALNLMGVDHADQVAEMIDLAEVSKRSTQPVDHWIISWTHAEQPTAAQVDQVARRFLEEMGLKDHQCIYALHTDTANLHMHLAINRVHPEREIVIEVNKGFSLNAAFRAIAIIEHEQGWKPEPNAVYRVEMDGPTVHVRHRDEKARAAVRELPREVRQHHQLRERKPSRRARDIEERTGDRSAERIAIEDGAPIIRAAKSWQELHQGLAAQGMRYERQGSGGKLWVGDQPVKPSSAGRDCSLPALEKQLGAFEPAAVQERAGEVKAREPEPLAPQAAPGWADYRKAREQHYAARAAGRGQKQAGQRAAWEALRDRHREARAKMFNESWRGRGDALNALRSVLARDQAAEKLELKERHQREREAARQEQRRGPFPRYEEWLRGRGADREAELWRHREREAPVIEGPRFEQPKPEDIRSFEPVIDRGVVHYRREGAPAIAFTDQGKRIAIHASERASVLAALQLSQQKWGEFVVTGNDKFKRLCVTVAAEHGLRLTNPELQAALAQERNRLQLQRQEELRGQPPRPERVPAGPADPVQQREAPTPASPAAPAELGRPKTVVDLYRRHFDEIAARAAGKPDPSRVDTEIAVRLRITGRSREEVARIIEVGAKATRPAEDRSWEKYGARAAENAFGVPGDRRASELAPHTDRLFGIEGRNRQHEIAEQQRIALERQQQLERERLQRSQGRGGPERGGGGRGM
jgi:hypothetical protein